MQARFRSDKFAAVLRLQRTQPKDRRIYTAFTGILARRPAPAEGTGRRAHGYAGTFYGTHRKNLPGIYPYSIDI
ncbi:hypothetical protein DXB25_03245 [Lachnospiraceae bacterium OM02-31]|nr:hypothetical protein DXB25_03245 [Lachnospiraceae bacterium OM02-31]RJW57688.1 hypothetical protein DXB24_08540 [Lachnospiraceae bacterium OM02-3]